MEKFTKTVLSEDKKGDLIRFLFSSLNPTDEEIDNQLDKLSELQNNGKIKFFSQQNLSTISNLDTSIFWAGLYSVCQLIPRLEGNSENLMQLTKTLVEKGGDGLAASHPNRAFLEWCTLDKNRSRNVIKLARTGNQLALDHLVFALSANNHFNEAFDFLVATNTQGRVAGAVALGRMHLSKNNCTKTLDQFETCLNLITDEVLINNILYSAFEVWEKLESESHYKQREIVALSLKKQFPALHHTIASILAKHTQKLTDEVLNMLLSTLLNVGTEQTQTLKNFNYAITKLCTAGYFDQVASFLVQLIEKNEGKIRFETFNNFGKQLKSNSNQLSKIAATLLTKGNVNVCDSFSALLHDGGNKNTHIDIKRDDIPADENDQLFMIRKAVGYFYMDPVSVASILLNFVKFGKSKAKLYSEELLLNPLYLSYGGDLHKYLIQISKSQSKLCRNAADRLLSKKRKYIENIQNTGSITELEPTEQERHAAKVLWDDKINEAIIQAKRGSIIEQIATTQHLLYGRSSISYIEQSNGTQKLINAQMNSFSHSFELPSLDFIDPVGLDMMLRTFRVEQRMISV